MRRNPHLLEINALTFINRLSAKYARPVTLGTVPDSEWKSLAESGFDYIWLMGVWQRSPASRRLAIRSPGLRKDFTRILPGWKEDDVSGSPYAIYSYNLEPCLGKADELASAKAQLNRLGMGLVLDFVPNHLAMDHPWTLAHPEYFVQGRPKDVKLHPDWFFRTKNTYLAHGRDPYFSAWDDTVQVNFYSRDLRKALIGELAGISDVADGVRCDMAMLALNGIFEWVWGGIVEKPHRPEAEFWNEAIGSVRGKHPDFLFMAEVYWDLDDELRELGFDFTYDKALYDHLRWDPAREIAQHIRDEGENIVRQVHFLENHDEPRVAALFGRERSMAAAIIFSTLPGMRFYQDGQLEGRQMRVPVQIAVEPAEKADSAISDLYGRLLDITKGEVFHEGTWRMLSVERAWESNESHHNVLAWQWDLGDRRDIIAVNYSAERSQAWLKPAVPPELRGQIVMEDAFSGVTYVREIEELVSKGLYVDLGPYRAHAMEFVLDQG